MAQLLGTPVERLVSRFTKPEEARLAAWEKRMRAEMRELERLTGELRAALERRRALLAAIQDHDARAEAALREGDEAKARAILLEKQEHVRRLALAREACEAWAETVRRAKERLAATKAEAGDLLRSAGLPPLDAPAAPRPAEGESAPRAAEGAPAEGAPRVRVKL